MRTTSMLFALVALVVAVAAQDDPKVTKASKTKKLTDEIKKSHTARGVSRLLYVDPDPGLDSKGQPKVQGHAMIGGNTKKDGDVGILYLIETAADVTLFVAWMKITPADAYVVLLAESVMADPAENTFTKLKATGKLSGVIMYDDDADNVVPYSAGSCNPNANFGIPFTQSDTVKWNNANNNCEEVGMHWRDLEVPFFFLPQEVDIFGQNGLYNFTKEHNFVPGTGGALTQDSDHYPLAGVKMTFFAWGSPNSVTCSRRHYCDPVGGQNLLGFMRPYQAGEDVVVVAAPSDAVALFHDDAYGIDAHAASVVTLLAAAKLVGDLADRSSSNVANNVMFTLFSGERFGYTGSSSMGRRINKTETFPATGGQMNEANITYYIELDQLIDASTGDATKWFLHTDKQYAGGDGNTNNDATIDVVAELTSDGDGTYSQSAATEMPPSSFRGLFNELETQRSSVGAVVISNYDTGFTNKNFESQYDAAAEFGFDADMTSDNKYVQQLCALAQKVAATAVLFANPVDGKPTAPTAKTNAGSFAIGTDYTITLTGNTDFTLIGAADSVVGTGFTATGVGTGTGQATDGTLAIADAADCEYITSLLKFIAVDRAESAGDAEAKIGSAYLSEEFGNPSVPLSRYVGVFGPSQLINHEAAFFMQLSYALRDRATSDLAYKMPGMYCHLVKGKKACDTVRGILRLCVGLETIFSTNGNCSTWNANIDAKGATLAGAGMYDSCIKDKAPTSGAPGGGDAAIPRLVNVGSGARAAYSGRTQYYCTAKDRKGKKADDSDPEVYTECMDKAKDGAYVYIDAAYKAAMNWNWVQTYPASRENCVDGACDTICMKSSVSWMDAPSPAINENWNQVQLIGVGKAASLENNRWSTWTESTWDADPTLESFLVSAPKADNAILGGGIGYFIFSILVVWIVNKNVEIIEE